MCLSMGYLIIIYAVVQVFEVENHYKFMNQVISIRYSVSFLFESLTF